MPRIEPFDLMQALDIAQRANRRVAFSEEGLADPERVWKGNRICNYLAEQYCDSLREENHAKG